MIRKELFCMETMTGVNTTASGAPIRTEKFSNESGIDLANRMRGMALMSGRTIISSLGELESGEIIAHPGETPILR
jgi:hypothetical protein